MTIDNCLGSGIKKNGPRITRMDADERVICRELLEGITNHRGHKGHKVVGGEVYTRFTN